jgi:hypothetical protein
MPRAKMAGLGLKEEERCKKKERDSERGTGIQNKEEVNNGQHEIDEE